MDAAADDESVVIEHLRVQVPADCVEAWLEAEQACWEPWLQQQSGFLGRELRWDPERQEGVLLIRWASRDQWHAIPSSEVGRIQDDFVRHARGLLREAFSHWGDGEGPAPADSDNPFPLLFSGEADPDLWAATARASDH
ncbi:MAG: TIGR03792 family protein [Synechococcaceae cyanobacterium]|nr:TIGR03792 family protein [Synechococcaceae cyanobacterium]